MARNPTQERIQDRLPNTINSIIRKTNGQRVAQLQPRVWGVPSLVNSWINFGGSDAVAGYYVDGANIVRLKGKVKSGTVGSPIFVLPVGYRPSENVIFAISSNDAFGVVKIDTSGNVTCTTGNNTYVSLDNISFRL